MEATVKCLLGWRPTGGTPTCRHAPALHKQVVLAASDSLRDTPIRTCTRSLYATDRMHRPGCSLYPWAHASMACLQLLCPSSHAMFTVFPVLHFAAGEQVLLARLCQECDSRQQGMVVAGLVLLPLATCIGLWV